MVGERFNPSDSASATIDAVQSLQSNNAEAIKAKRKHRRFEIRTRVITHPADVQARGELKWLGECHDISQGGCRLLVKKPLILGSLYWIEFEPTDVHIDPVFARCVRGHILRESAFEFGMCFLTPIELPEPEDAVEADVVLL